MRAPIRFRQPGRAATVLGVVLAAACSGSTSLADRAVTQVRIDLSALEERTVASRQESGVSVVDQVSLIVDAVDGTRLEDVRQVGAGESEVTFDVTVPQGLTSFEASVFSNNGTPIFFGAADQEITGDQAVIIDVEPIDAVLAAFPDSLELRPDTADVSPCFGQPCGEVVVMNPGSEDLTWRVEGTSPPIDSCEQIPSPCFVPADSTLSPGGTHTVRFTLFEVPPGELVTVRFGSQVGEVDVKVLVP